MCKKFLLLCVIKINSKWLQYACHVFCMHFDATHPPTHTFWHVQEHNGISGKMRNMRRAGRGSWLNLRIFCSLGRDRDFPRQCNKLMAEILELANDNDQVAHSPWDKGPLRSLHLSISGKWRAVQAAAKFIAITVWSHLLATRVWIAPPSQGKPQVGRERWKGVHILTSLEMQVPGQLQRKAESGAEQGKPTCQTVITKFLIKC